MAVAKTPVKRYNREEYKIFEVRLFSVVWFCGVVHIRAYDSEW
jgi:hypothetical protein